MCSNSVVNPLNGVKDLRSSFTGVQLRALVFPQAPCLRSLPRCRCPARTPQRFGKFLDGRGFSEDSSAGRFLEHLPPNGSGLGSEGTAARESKGLGVCPSRRRPCEDLRGDFGEAWSPSAPSWRGDLGERAAQFHPGMRYRVTLDGDAALAAQLPRSPKPPATKRLWTFYMTRIHSF